MLIVNASKSGNKHPTCLGSAKEWVCFCEKRIHGFSKRKIPSMFRYVHRATQKATFMQCDNAGRAKLKQAHTQQTTATTVTTGFKWKLGSTITCEIGKVTKRITWQNSMLKNRLLKGWLRKMRLLIIMQTM